jgi:formamidopyrimidine-DNA glycosylase
MFWRAGKHHVRLKRKWFVMPELPEVETVARDLRPLLIGRTLESLRKSKFKLRQKWSKAWEKEIISRQVVAVHRRGKWILIELDTAAYVMVHLGMTGQLKVVPNEHDAEDHTHVLVVLDNQTELRFTDPRRFGSVAYFTDQAAWEKFLAGKLGPEPWDMPLNVWLDGLKKKRRNLKAILLDQTFIAGVGNIYADESTFAAKLNPRRLGSSLKPAEAERLLEAIRATLTRAIEARGSTIRNYVGGSGLTGEFQNEHSVYGRTGEPCRVCGKKIQCIRLAGRATHFCPKCQK